MIMKKTLSILTAMIFTVSTISCSSNIKKDDNVGSTTKNTGTSQVADSNSTNSQQSSFALRVVMAIVIGAIISKVVKDKTESKIEDTINGIINGQ